MQSIAATISLALRKMDQEAAPREGKSTGLLWYAAHSRPDLKRPQTEPEWSKRVAVLLSEAGYPARCECRYPISGSRQKCDVVVDLPPPKGGKLWLEIKAAWKHWWMNNRGKYGERIYRSYLFSPLLPGLDVAKSHTAALDLRKLETIPREHGTHIGLLLIGFDGEGEYSMLSDVQQFVALAKLKDLRWQMSSDWWEDHHRPGQFVRSWLWTREISSQ